MRQFKTLIILPLLFLLPTLSSATQETPTPPAWDISQLMQERAQIKSAKANFTEVRTTPSIDTATTSTASGTLVYQAPDRLERHTVAPSGQHAIVQGDRMILEIETSSGQRKRRELALTKIPGLRPFFIALRAVLAGDLETLQKNFDIAFSGERENWQMKLTPRPASNLQVRQIQMTGGAEHIRTIEMEQKNGDSSRTTLTPEPESTATSPAATES